MGGWSVGAYRRYPGDGGLLVIGSECKATDIAGITVSLCAAWDGDTPYVVAKVPLPSDPTLPTIRRYRGGPRRGVTGTVAAWRVGDDVGRVAVLAGHSPQYLDESFTEGEGWRAAREFIAEHVALMLKPWGKAHPEHFQRARIEQLEAGIAQTVEELKRVSTVSEAYMEMRRQEMSDLAPRIETAMVRLAELGVWELNYYLTRKRWWKGWRRVEVATSRGMVRAEVRTGTRLTILVAVEDVSLRAALEALMEQWWAHWFERLRPALGWFEVAEELRAVSRTCTRERRRVSTAVSDTYPPSYPRDPEAEAIFPMLEKPMLLAAYRMLFAQQRKLKYELEYISQYQHGPEEKQTQFRAELARVKGAANWQEAMPLLAMWLR